MIVLVTGGSGFIGRALVLHILKTTDWQVVSLDNLSYATKVSALVGDPAFDKGRVKIVYHDMRAPIHDGLREEIDECRYVFSVASDSHVDRSIANPVPFVMNNVALILNLLEWARVARPQKIFHISTDEVYGPAPDHYAYQEWDRLIPSNPYSASKACQEQICIAYWRTYGLPVFITNTMNNFGPGQHHEKFVPLVVGKLLAGESVPVHGEVYQGEWRSGSRVWLHATNHADALLYLAKNVKPVTFPESDRPSRYHIAGDKEITNLAMVHRIARILNVKSKWHWEDWHLSRPGHDLRYALDGSLLRSMWTPPLTLEEGLRQTVLACRGILF